MFRGAVREGLVPFTSRWLRILVTAVLFAVLHFRGFPSGPVGMAMVLVWGVALGYLRERSEGMLVPIVAHIGADLAIFAILALRLAYPKV